MDAFAHSPGAAEGGKLMGVYIKGMKMPDNCCNCPLGDAADGWYCKLTGYTYNWGNPNRASWCPLVPVPKHGGLIDADALPLEDSVPTVMMHDGERWISAYELAMAPTIIPAEEGE